MTQIAVYDGSRLMAVIEASPRIAWRTAVTMAKASAYQAAGLWRGCDVHIPGVWYRTKNREGFICGTYRATQLRAVR